MLPKRCMKFITTPSTYYYCLNSETHNTPRRRLQALLKFRNTQHVPYFPLSSFSVRRKYRVSCLTSLDFHTHSHVHSLKSHVQVRKQVQAYTPIKRHLRQIHQLLLRGPLTVSKKSKFQGSVCFIESEEDLKEALKEIISDRKV